MKIAPPVVMTAVVAAMLIVGVWLAPAQTREATRSVNLPVSTYNALVQFGDTRRSADGKSMPVANVIESLLNDSRARESQSVVDMDKQ